MGRATYFVRTSTVPEQGPGIPPKRTEACPTIAEITLI